MSLSVLVCGWGSAANQFAPKSELAQLLVDVCECSESQALEYETALQVIGVPRSKSKLFRHVSKGYITESDLSSYTNIPKVIIASLLGFVRQESPRVTVPQSQSPPSNLSPSHKWRKNQTDVLLDGLYYAAPYTAFISTSKETYICDAYINGPKSKFFKLKLSPNRKMLVREMETLLHVQNKNPEAYKYTVCCHRVTKVATSLGDGIFNGKPCFALVMDRGERSLYQAFKNGFFSNAALDKKLSVIKEVTRAIEAINKAGLVWMDAKPGVSKCLLNSIP